MSDNDALVAFVTVIVIFMGIGVWIGRTTVDEITPVEPNAYVLQRGGDTYFCVRALSCQAVPIPEE